MKTLTRLITALLLLISVQGWGQNQFSIIPSFNNEMIQYIAEPFLCDSLGDLVSVFSTNNSYREYALGKFSNQWSIVDSQSYASIDYIYPFLTSDKYNNIWQVSDTCLIKYQGQIKTKYRFPTYVTQSPGVSILGLCSDVYGDIWTMMSISDTSNTTYASGLWFIKYNSVNMIMYRLIDYDTSNTFISCGLTSNSNISLIAQNGSVIFWSSNYYLGYIFDGNHLKVINLLANASNFEGFLGHDNQNNLIGGFTYPNSATYSKFRFFAFDSMMNLLYTTDTLRAVNSYPGGVGSVRLPGNSGIDKNNMLWYVNSDSLCYFNLQTGIQGQVTFPTYLKQPYSGGSSGFQIVDNTPYFNEVKNTVVLMAWTNGGTNPRPNTRIVEFNLDTFYHYLPASAGPNQVFCESALHMDTFTATMAATGIGTWSALSTNPQNTTISNPSSPTTTISALPYGWSSGVYHFVWTSGSIHDTMSVTVDSFAALFYGVIDPTTTSVCSGGIDSFTIMAGSSGLIFTDWASSTVSFQWYENSIPVGANSAAYTSPPLAPGDSIWVRISTLSNFCVNGQVGGVTLPASFTVNNCTCNITDSLSVTSLSGGNYTVTAYVSGVARPSYTWYTPTYGRNVTSSNSFSGTMYAYYPFPEVVRVTVYDSATGCSVIDSITIPCYNDSISYQALGGNMYVFTAHAPLLTHSLEWDISVGNTQNEYFRTGSDTLRLTLPPATYTVTVYDLSCGTLGADSIMGFVVPLVNNDTVWPGDADANKLVDNNDLLTIGLAYDSTGPVRAVQGIVWQGDTAALWQHYFSIYAPLVNFNNADCNGDGIVNANDTLAIVTNFGYVHAKTNSLPGLWRSGLPGITLSYNRDTVLNGDTLVTSIIAGDSLLSVHNIYGLAFTFNYDPIVVDTNHLAFAFTPSWLGNSSNSININRNFNSGMVKAAITGINHTARSGYGKIATFTAVITTGNINGKNLSYYTNHSYISNVTAIDQLGNPVPLNSAIDSNYVGYIPNGIVPVNAPANITIVPNPAATVVKIMADAAITGITLTNMLGEEVAAIPVNNKHTETIDITNLAAGVYVVHVAAAGGIATAKLVVGR